MNRLMLVFGAAMLCGLAFGADEVPLWPEGKMPSPQANQPYKPYLVWHTPKELKSDAILISVSGGSYMGCGIDGFEVSPIRDYFLSKGVTVVTMRYRTPRPQGLPKHVTAWQDAQRTVRMVRSEAKKRGLNPDNIGFTGCSAGGHLTLMVATSSQTPAYEPIDELDQLPCNVNWAVPVYPAYGLVPNTEKSEVEKCNDLSVDLVPEFKFDSATPPMCLMHGDSDGWTPMVSVRVYHKLRTMHIPAELHIMAKEPHCFMRNPVPGTPADTWKDRVWEWCLKSGIVSVHPYTGAAGWRTLLDGNQLEQLADFEKGVWEKYEDNAFTASKDSAIWAKGEYENFVLDFEYKMDPAANSGVVIYCSDKGNWIPNSVEVQLLDDFSDKWKKDPPHLKNAGLYGHIGPKYQSLKKAGEWNHMTIWAEGKNIRIALNGANVLDTDLNIWKDAKTNPDGTKIPPWLSKPFCELPTKGSIGFQGKHGGARPYFRNVKIKELGK